MPCYDDDMHPDARREWDYLKLNGHKDALGRLFQRLEDVVVSCKKPYEFGVQVAGSGRWLFARNEWSGLVGVFTLSSSVPRVPGTKAMFTVVAINFSSKQAFLDAKTRV
jgi:hypothetical protein